MASVAGSLIPLREPATIFCGFRLSFQGRPQWQVPQTRHRANSRHYRTPALRATLQTQHLTILRQQVPKLLQFPGQPDHR